VSASPETPIVSSERETELTRAHQRERDREKARDSFPVRVVRWETGALAGVAASVISYLTWHNAVCVWVCLVICPFWHGSKRPAGGHEITKRRAAFINLIQHIRRLMGEGEGFAALLTSVHQYIQ